MERKSNSYSTDIPSPVLLRRRLSAPETIMRKHVLAQQRSESQESDVTQASDTRSCQWRSDIATGSDPNLNRKRDSGLMRKSTLLRRLWSNSKPATGSRFSGSFYEWQHSFGKMSPGKSTHSLTSNHTSPEHKSQSRRSLNINESKTSPKHKSSFSSRKMSPKHQQNINASPQRYNLNNNYSSNSTSTSTTIETDQSNYLDNRTCSTVTPKTSTTETEIETTESYSTRSTSTSYTTFSDLSDSAFTNSKSTLSQYSNNNTSTNSSEITKQFIGDSDNSNQEGNQAHINIERKKLGSAAKSDSSTIPNYVKYSSPLHESSTQTSDITNLNVISNVELSQSTLDLIFQQVIQDVNKSAPNKISINTIPVPATVVENETEKTEVKQVKETPSFYLKRKEDITVGNQEHSRIVKYMISNIGTGSPYSKPAEIPQVVVPRFSALPRTCSMEVNISSGDSDDKESDSTSLVDSLEDPQSPRLDLTRVNNNEKIPHKGELSLSPILPDNSDKKKSKSVKASSFFIPIELNDNTEMKAVSDLLPNKVREKLARRQQKREEKLLQTKSKMSSPRSDSNYISASDNQLHFVVDTSSDLNLNSTPNLPTQVNYNKHKQKRSKPLLPSIESIRKIKIDRRDSRDKPKELKNKPIKRKSKENSIENIHIKNQNKTQWMSKIGRNKMQEKLTPIYSTKNEYVYDTQPRRIYHKTEFSNNNKRIEILEIMECVEPTDKVHNQLFKGKSKIPVLINQKLPKISEKTQKPSFLDFEQVEINDPKLDQLIANILIDTLNNSTSADFPFITEKDQNLPDKQFSAKHTANSKYHQKFEVIPEESNEGNAKKDIRNNNEKFVEKTEESFENNNLDEACASNYNQEETKTPTVYKGKAAVAVVRDENLSTIPKGWITFYMLHKNQGSPDSTSDEGKKYNNQIKQSKSNECIEDNNIEIKRSLNLSQNENQNISARSNATYDIVKKKKPSCESLNNFSSSSEDTASKFLHLSNGKNTNTTTNNSNIKNYHNKHRKFEQKSSEQSGEWSVTVSGTNSYGQLAPELEMRLKFPNQQDSNPHESELEDEYKRKVYLPSINNNKAENKIESGNSNRRWLPEIPKTKFTRRKKSDASVPIMSIIPSSVEPRQTRTSTRRYNLTRPKLEPELSPISTTNKIFTEREYEKILKQFPDILTVHGRSISPERKPKVPTMSERDLSRHFFMSPH